MEHVKDAIAAFSISPLKQRLAKDTKWLRHMILGEPFIRTEPSDFFNGPSNLRVSSTKAILRRKVTGLSKWKVLSHFKGSDHL